MLIEVGILVKDDQSNGWYTYQNTKIEIDDDTIMKIGDRYFQLKLKEKSKQ